MICLRPAPSTFRRISGGIPAVGIRVLNGSGRALGFATEVPYKGVWAAPNRVLPWRLARERDVPLGECAARHRGVPMPDVRPIPDGYTAITPYLIVEDAAGFLDFLANAFGAVERLRIPMGEELIGHAEVEIRGAAVMLSDAAPPDFPVSSSQLHLVRGGR